MRRRRGEVYSEETLPGSARQARRNNKRTRRPQTPPLRESRPNAPMRDDQPNLHEVTAVTRFTKLTLQDRARFNHRVKPYIEMARTAPGGGYVYPPWHESEDVQDHLRHGARPSTGHARQAVRRRGRGAAGSDAGRRAKADGTGHHPTRPGRRTPLCLPGYRLSVAFGAAK